MANNNKSLLLTYIFSLIGGLYGLHHLYLGRTQHALLWLTTFGGFGIGFIYELLFLIKTYVYEANHDYIILNEYRLKMIEKKSPNFEISRLCGQYLTAVFYGFITYYAFPEKWHENVFLSLFIGCCSTIAIALGTQIVGTLGPRQCSFIWPLLGAICGMPFLIWHINFVPSFNIAAFFSCWIFTWKVQWNREYFSNNFILKSTEQQFSISSKQIKRKRCHIIKNCLIFGLGVMIFSAMFTSAIYQNLQVDVKGQRIKLKDVLNDFFKSQEFILMREKLVILIRRLWVFYLHYGFKGLWMIFGFENTEKQALEVLNLSNVASQKDIESQCRTLSRKWHPDKYQDPEQKQKAQVTFMNIQQACDRLSNERKRRQLIKTQKYTNTN
ncbi:unnamed protein product [Rotaria sp. Silwood1]|nr:unnamed protein product [Rotaria sp. Silwood1]CAF1167324.1 unnamed protein product [Rotaria sp. Silwood1]CAF3459408.1 unnamed protein product [Rotaria sp. Silwood1]CAF3466104.1 unnamed protein product [Rotaria sp. Silwood1]CAF4570933.1 unnamed protein product [Rotaria sp. Silwood1]